jgi:hypothetical protein
MTHTAFAAGEAAKGFGAIAPLVRFGNRQLNSGYHTMALHAIAMRGSNPADYERRGREVPKAVPSSGGADAMP